MGVERYRDGFTTTLHPDLLSAPRTWKGSRRVFVNSMSDLFHKDVPTEFIQQVFSAIAEAPNHIFQILTKRSGRLAQLSSRLDWPANLWMGVSVENEKTLKRVDDLRRVPAAVRFLSCEPLLGPLPSLTLTDVGWVIVGGESGPGARPMKEEWVQEILGKCRASDVPFFFKQWGGVRKKTTGRELNDQTYDEFPDSNRSSHRTAAA